MKEFNGERNHLALAHNAEGGQRPVEHVFDQTPGGKSYRPQQRECEAADVHRVYVFRHLVGKDIGGKTTL